MEADEYAGQHQSNAGTSEGKNPWVRQVGITEQDESAVPREMVDRDDGNNHSEDDGIATNLVTIFAVASQDGTKHDDGASYQNFIKSNFQCDLQYVIELMDRLLL